MMTISDDVIMTSDGAAIAGLLSASKYLTLLVVEFRIPLRAAALGHAIQQRPDGHQIRRPTRVLPRIGLLEAHLATPEMANLAVPPGKYIETGDVRAIGSNGVIVTTELPSRIRIEFQI